MDYMVQPSRDELLVCFTRAYTIPGFVYLAAHKAEVRYEWRQVVTQYLSQIGQDTKCSAVGPRESSASSASAALEVPGCPAACTRSLRVVISQREKKRILVNVDKVVKLLARYTDQPIMRITVNEKTPPADQMMNFRCFDIFLSAHGSQLFGMIFTPSSNQVFVEVASLPGIDDPALPFCKSGKLWTKSWIISHGHLPVRDGQTVVDRSLVKAWDECFARIPEGQGSNRSSYISREPTTAEDERRCNIQPFHKAQYTHSRLVDLDYLLEDFLLAVRSKCDCQAPPPAQRHQCNWAFLPEARLRRDAANRKLAAAELAAKAAAEAAGTGKSKT